MFPNSANSSFYLLNINSVIDGIGSKRNYVKSKKEVIGMIRSITSNEFQASYMLNQKIELKIIIPLMVYDESKYVLHKDKIYKIERTYINGQYIELYLSLTDLNLGDF